MNKILKAVKYLIKIIIIKNIYYVFRLFPIRNNKVFISSYYGKGYGDNAKCICDYLIRKDKSLDIVWVIKDEKEGKSLPKQIRNVKRNTLKYIYEQATSRIWIDNCRKQFYERKRKKQYYIQTWHSSLRLKKIEKDAEASLDQSYLKDCKNDSKMIDLITSGSKFSTNIYKKSFWYDGKVLECGTPRCDIFFNKKEEEKVKNKVLKRLNIHEAKKIILYAPTFRKNVEENGSYIDYKKLIESLGDDYIVIVRMHPISKASIPKIRGLINATNYPDMQELLIASDYLVTDYSGCCFDMMIARKPCILYTPDLEHYQKDERGLYFKIEDLPFENTKTIKKLVDTLINFNSKRYQERIKTFGEKIGLLEDGNATPRIANIIIETINE